MDRGDGRNTKKEELRVYRDQLTTIGDLEIFKNEIIQEIKSLLNAGAAPPAKKWFKSTEVKKMLGISTGTLQNLRRNGSISHSRIGGIIFYSYEDIVDLLKKS
jgi:hypothetical protein